jgi:DNA-binding Xre family transcriptional regulator
MSQLKLAEMQLVGFAHASKGFGIKELAESMGMTKKEWIKLRNGVSLKQLDKIELDELFGI